MADKGNEPVKPEKQQEHNSSLFDRFLNGIERAGNKLPDPAMLFFLLMVFVWILSAVLAPIDFGETHPLTGNELSVNNLLTGEGMANFLANMVETFVLFAPLGIVLVAMLGVGVAEHSGWISAGLKKLLSFTPKSFLTPMLILIAIVSHTAADAGYVLVIPLGGVIFYAAGRHPLAGIAAAFAGVSGGFSANFIPSAIDPLIMSFTLEAARILDPEIVLNPLNNIYFTGASSIVIVLVGWFITDKIVEPRLSDVKVDGDEDEIPEMETVTKRESRAFWLGFGAMLLGIIGLLLWALPEGSALRDPEWNNPEVSSLFSFHAPLMQAIVPLIFILLLIPGVVYGYASGKYKSSKDMINNMSKSMESMGYYIVMAFFCALFIDAFAKSNIGLLIALKGANFLQSLALPGQVTIVGIVFLSAFVNILVGSASAKWALIAPIFVPMLMQLGISPDLTQAAYRVGDSVSNIITPLLPYFPLVVVFCQRYVKKTGIGTVISMMLPYSIIFLIVWTAFLLLYWWIGIPLSFESNYVYPAP
ncbi:AbgT family transporter [Gracilimonas mengyeensis]|uniref:Aminobenzoyl-glutamate transport protein n=1 Tax=Gracilimonas mengyeensis TaxID=1302730 RepID=A0A521AIM9_9BACT|nr:AbgT family transporter [Gracilimonas mengyeensis]SMO34695.1 aminobenzoyl-glutamate transport protein [Gracilimonas mengyeensis]